MTVRFVLGDARQRLTEMPDRSVHCCVTSPPYFGLRDYGVDGQIGLEATSSTYFFAHEAIKEPVAPATKTRLAQSTFNSQAGSTRVPGKTNGAMKAVGGSEFRSPRSVWTVTTQPYREAHFATFPSALIEPCILAGCPTGGHVLPFGGAGTTGLVADKLGRDATLIELNPDYVALAERRILPEFML